MLEEHRHIMAIHMILVTILTIVLIFKASGKRVVLYILSGWVILQGAAALTLFYTHTAIIPPRFILLVAPPLLVTLLIFLTPAGRRFMDGMDGKTLTYLHTVRILVELLLFELFTWQYVPRLMTFAGGNFDILSGLTAPLIAYFGYTRKILPRAVLLIWNFICLGLLLNIVIHAVLSAPGPLQQMAFDQPNIAVLYFPFVWLPCCIVPIVLFSHLVLIRQLILKKVI